MAQLPPTFELAEPPPIAPLLPRWSYGTMAFAMLGAVLLLCLVIFLLRRKSSHKSSEETLRGKAWREADAAFVSLQAKNARDAATESSLILRRYLATALQDPSLFETHEETLARGDALSFFPEETKQRTASCFASLAALKYAPETGNQTPAEVIASAREVLSTIHQGHL